MRKITFYKLDGQVKSEEILTKENLMHISGMMTKCYLKSGKEEVGFADPTGVYDKEKYNGKIKDYIYLWTWDNLDENTDKLIGDNDEKYNQTFKAVKIAEIEKIGAITYSNPRWGGKLTNKFEFYKKEKKEKDLDIPKFLIKKSDEEDSNDIEKSEEELYYFLTVKYEDYFGDKEYNYISEDTTITIGDRVLVDRAGTLAIAEVIETAYCNKFDAPFPVDKTKRIIKKVDDDFEIDDIDEHDIKIIKMNIDGTYFEFGIDNYLSGKDNDENWTNIKIKVHNPYFKYERFSELLTSAEIERLLKELERLVDDNLEEKVEIGFYEPDLDFNLYPKINLWDTGKYAYIKEGNEIQDIYMELNINLTDIEGAYTGQKYVMIFDREEIKKIVEYIKSIIKK